MRSVGSVDFSLKLDINTKYLALSPSPPDQGSALALYGGGGTAPRSLLWPSTLVSHLFVALALK